MKPINFIYTFFSLLIWATASLAADVTIPNTFSNGQTADANDINANFTAIEAAVDDNDSRISTLESHSTEVFRYNQSDSLSPSGWTSLAYTSFSFTKQGSSSRVKITWTDNIRSYLQPGSCAWHLTIDGNSCSPSPLILNTYNNAQNSSNIHITASTTQVCEGLASGTHSLIVWVKNQNNSQCHRGYLDATHNPLGTGPIFPASIIVEEIE